MFPGHSPLRHFDCPDYVAKGKCERVACPFGHTEQAKAESLTAGKRDEPDDTGDEGNAHKKQALSAEPARRFNAHHGPSFTTSAPSSARSLVDSQRSELSSRPSARRMVEELYSHGARGASLAQPAQRPAQPSNGAAAAVRSSNVARAEAAPAPAPSLARPATNESKPAAARGPTSAVQSRTSLDNGSTGMQLTAPSIARHAHPSASKIPYSVRQSSLRTFFTTFVSLYAPLRPPTTVSTNGSIADKDGNFLLAVERAHALLERVVHQIASEDALVSESKIYKMSNTNPMTYKNSVRTELVGVMRRRKEDGEAQSKEQTCIGTLGIEVLRRALVPDGAAEEDEKDVKSSPEAGTNGERELHAFLRQSELIGTQDEVKHKLSILTERRQGLMTSDKLAHAGLLADTEQLALSGYPMPPASKVNDEKNGKGGSSASATWADISPEDVQECIDQSWGAGGEQPDMVGERMECNRCGESFVVREFESAHDAEAGSCCYHWGKCRLLQRVGRARGPRERRWTCCEALDESSGPGSTTSLSEIAKDAGFAGAKGGLNRRLGSVGCTYGPHVFKEENDEDLHRREAFLSTEALLAQCSNGGSPAKRHDILAFDCELIYTTAGMSLARLTVLDEEGAKLLDQHIRPHATVLDYNTRFSGVRPEDFPATDGDRYTLKGARRALGRLMTQQTIFVGHGLENDLRAMRLIHTRIVDSALLYPHPRGLPFRMSLRELARTHLGRYIQNDDAEAGHDPEIDARAALDLVRLKYRGELGAIGSAAESNKLSPSQACQNVPASPSSVTQTTASAPLPRRPAAPGPTSQAMSSLFLPRDRRR